MGAGPRPRRVARCASACSHSCKLYVLPSNGWLLCMDSQPRRSLVQGEARVVGQAARCRPQTQNVFPNSPCHHFCALRYFSFVFLFFFLPFFLDPCREAFLCPKVFLRFFCCVFVSFFWTPAVKMKKKLYLCLYPLAHLQEVQFFENVAAYHSWPLMEATGSVRIKLRPHNTFVLTPKLLVGKVAEGCLFVLHKEL